MARIVRLTKQQLAEKLAELESELKMPAQEFYDRYLAGELGDSPETLHWAGVCYLALQSGLLTPQPSHA
jgi:hypothetical protein